MFLIGSNGAGKSSTLQALAFIQSFAAGKPSEFISERHWNKLDLRSKTVEKTHNTLRYHLLFEDSDNTRVLWQFAWGLGSEALIIEQMWIGIGNLPPKKIFSFDRKNGLRSEVGGEVKGIVPPGSITALIQIATLTHHHEKIAPVLDWCERITSLELLNPVAMRSNARGSPKGIGTRGQRLAGFLASLDTKTKARIVDRLSDFYPLSHLSTTKKKAGWVDLKIGEAFSIGHIPAQHMSDGFMRLLALCAIPEFGSRASLVLLDEIEDGIEPHILPRLIDRIVQDSSAQFVMTSHSPLLVNFFPPENVTLVTRSPEGRSIFCRISDLDIIKKGREYLGPGEIWANSGLMTWNEEAAKAGSAKPDNSTATKFSDAWASEFMGRP